MGTNTTGDCCLFPLPSPQMVQSVLRGLVTHQTSALTGVDKAYQCVATSGQGGSSVLCAPTFDSTTCTREYGLVTTSLSFHQLTGTAMGLSASWVCPHVCTGILFSMNCE